MAQMNRVQFQPEMSIDQFKARDGTQDNAKPPWKKSAGATAPYVRCAHAKGITLFGRQGEDIPVPNLQASNYAHERHHFPFEYAASDEVVSSDVFAHPIEE